MPLIPIAIALAQFAPSLLKLFGADEPTVGVANKVISIAQTITGTSNPEEALESMKANAAAQAAFNMAVLQQDRELQLALLTDVQDARARDNSFRTVSQKNLRGDVLAYAAIGGLLVCLLTVLFSKIPEGVNRDLLFTLIGVLTMLVKDVYSFEFGTTRQSKDKDVVISGLTKHSSINSVGTRVGDKKL